MLTSLTTLLRIALIEILTWAAVTVFANEPHLQTIDVGTSTFDMQRRLESFGFPYSGFVDLSLVGDVDSPATQIQMEVSILFESGVSSVLLPRFPKEKREFVPLGIQAESDLTIMNSVTPVSLVLFEASNSAVEDTHFTYALDVP